MTIDEILAHLRGPFPMENYEIVAWATNNQRCKALRLAAERLEKMAEIGADDEELPAYVSPLLPVWATVMAAPAHQTPAQPIPDRDYLREFWDSLRDVHKYHSGMTVGEAIQRVRNRLAKDSDPVVE